MSTRTEFRVWTDMRRRCTQPHRPDYHRYGGRGITVCDEWMESFEAFYADMGDRPSGTTLDRRENGGPYCKDNCYWATKKEQSRNTRQNKYIVVNGVEMVQADAADMHGLTQTALSLRLRNGMTPDEAIAKPARKKGQRFVFFGEEMTIIQAARKYGVSRSMLKFRLQRSHMHPNDAVTRPKIK